MKAPLLFVVLVGTLVLPITSRGADAPAFATILVQNPKLKGFLTTTMTESTQGGPLRAYTAVGFASSIALWSSSSAEILWATAKPPTEATACEIGVLILVELREGKWSLADVLHFTATGKESGADAKITSLASIPDYDVPVVTVELCQGGRGYSYAESFTYSAGHGKFSLHMPKP